MWSLSPPVNSQASMAGSLRAFGALHPSSLPKCEASDSEHRLTDPLTQHTKSASLRDSEVLPVPPVDCSSSLFPYPRCNRQRGAMSTELQPQPAAWSEKPQLLQPQESGTHTQVLRQAVVPRHTSRTAPAHAFCFAVRLRRCQP